MSTGVDAESEPHVAGPARLHHHAYVSADLAATRAFYEDVLGLPLVATWVEREEVMGVEREYCHVFFGLDDGSCLAFFQFADPAAAAELAPPGLNPFVHLALAVDSDVQDRCREALRGAGHLHHEIDHGYCHSLYTVDPDGLLLEFTVDSASALARHETIRDRAHDELDRWLSGDRTPNNDLR